MEHGPKRRALGTTKYALIDRLCSSGDPKLNCMVFADPTWLGDTYDEVMRSLERIGQAGVLIKIELVEKDKPDLLAKLRAKVVIDK